MISLTLGAIFLPKLHSVSDIPSSLSAIYAADSAIELCIYQNRKVIPPAPPAILFANGASYTMTNLLCGSTPLSTQAVGTFRGVSRSLQLDI